MSDQTENIIISVQDKIASSIAPKLQTIETNALQAMDAFTRMQQAVDKVSGANIRDLASAMKGVGSSVTQLARGLDIVGTSAQAAATRIAGFIGAIATANVQVKQLITTLATLATAYGGAAAGSAVFNVAQKGTSSSLGSTVGGARAAAIEVGVLRGSMMGGARAAGAFLASFEMLGPVIAAAFPVIGLIALISIVYQGISALVTFIQTAKKAPMEVAAEWRRANDEISHSTDSLILENDKLQAQIDKMIGHPGRNELAIAFDTARVSADQLDESIDRDIAKFAKLAEGSKKTSVSFLGGLITGQAPTSDSEKLLQSVAANIQGTKDQYDATFDSANASGNAENVQQLTMARLTALSNAYVDAQRKIEAAIDATEQKQNDFKASGIGIDQTAKINLLAGAYRDLELQQRDLGEEYNKSQLVPKVDKLRDALDQQRQASKALRDESRQATEYMRNLQQQLDKMEIDQSRKGPVTSKELVSFYRKAEGDPQAQHNSIIMADLKNKEAAAVQRLNAENERQQKVIDELTLTYTSQLAEIHLYGTELREYEDNLKINEALIRGNIDINSEQAQVIRNSARSAADAYPYHRELNRIFDESIHPIQTYTLTLQAATELMTTGVTTVEQWTQIIHKAKADYLEATDPLYRFNEALAEQHRLFGLVGQDRVVQQGLNSLNKETQQKFKRDSTPQEISAATEKLKQADDEASVQKELDSIYDSTRGVMDRLEDSQKALTISLANHTITTQEAAVAMTQLQIAMANARLEAGNDATTIKDVLGGAFGSLIADIQPLTISLKDALGGSLKTAMDGLADSMSKSLVYAKNLGAALKDVARQAVSELTSALIKLALQYTILWALQKLFHIKKDDNDDVKKKIKAQAELTAASIANMAIVAAAGKVAAEVLSAAWWPVAEAVSLASFGSNAIGATAGIATVTALGTAASKFAMGGYVTGPSGTDNVPAWLTQGEFVMKQSAVNQIGVPALTALNEGRTSAARSSSTTTQMKINVVHDGSTNVQVVQGATHDEVHIIARNVAQQTVQTHSSSVIAADIQNPNSRVSKAITRNTFTQRRRE